MDLIVIYSGEFGIGRPEVRVEVDRRGRIAHVEVLRSAPCGSTWFVAKQLEGIEVEDKRELYERISESHHSYPCTASMEKDRELGDTILHRAGYIIRAAVEAVKAFCEAYDEAVEWTNQNPHEAAILTAKYVEGVNAPAFEESQILEMEGGSIELESVDDDAKARFEELLKR